MIKSQRSGRHLTAPAVKPMTAGVVTAAAASAGMMFSSAVPAAVGTEEQVGASERIDLADTPVEDTSQEFTVQTEGTQDFALDNVTVTAEAPVVEEPAVEEPAPVTEEAPATTEADTTETQEQDAPAPAPQETPTATQDTGTTAQQNAPAQAPAPAPAPAPAAPAPAAQAPAPAAPASGRGAQVVAIARSHAGAPYVWGGTSPAGWDCIGFAGYVYRQVGVSVPASSSGAQFAGPQVPASQAQPGDMMWWPGHVGIYTGNGMHIAAWNPTMGTKEAPVWGSPKYMRVL